MDNLLTIALEAHHAEHNHHRRYELTLGRDLFDAFTLTIRYGRIGHGSQTRRYSAPQPDELKTILRRHLQRRLSAHRRIGCSYRLTTVSTTTGFQTTDWLPADLLTQFGAAA